MPAAWVGAGAAVLGAVGSYENGKKQASASSAAAAAADPYAQYRPQAAQQLNTFVNDPNSQDATANSSVGMAYQQAAARTMAAQGYTGSGNALVAAANAGGQAYQQQFNNLATLAGANYSPATAAQMSSNNAATNAQNNTNTLSNLGGLASQLSNGLGGTSSPPSSLSEGGGAYGAGAGGF